MVLCECGCGQVIEKPRVYRSSRTKKIVTQRFITGHENTFNLHKIMNSLTKEKAIELYINKNHSATAISKICKCCSTTIITILKKYGIKTRTKKESQQNYLKNNNERSKNQSKFMKDNNAMSTEIGIKNYMKHIHTQPKSSIEIKMAEELTRKEIEFQEQVNFHNMFLDFLLPNKVVIECDGRYWHNLPENKIRDIRKNKLLKEEGYKLFRFTDKEINQDVEKCVEKLSL